MVQNKMSCKWNEFQMGSKLSWYTQNIKSPLNIQTHCLIDHNPFDKHKVS